MSIKNLVIFLLVIVILVSCSEANNSMLVSEITGSVDSLKQVYAPDTRVVLWNVAINKENGRLYVTAEVGNKKAWTALQNLSFKHHDVIFSIKLLPETNKNSTGFALINNSVSNIRKEGRHSAELINQALLGTPVKVLKKKAGWYLIQTPNRYLGWINKADVVLLDSATFKE